MEKYTNGTKREKKSYNGEPVPEGMKLAPVWMKRDNVREFDSMDSDNLTTWSYAGFKFLIAYVPVPEEMYEEYRKECHSEVNRHIAKYRAGRCIIGERADGTKIICPKTNRCTGCPHKGEYERYNPAKEERKEISFEEMERELYVTDHYPVLEDHGSDEEKLKLLLEHLRSVDSRYADIVAMKSAGIDVDEICERIHLKKSRGYQVIEECYLECRRFWNLGTSRVIKHKRTK